MRVKVAEDLTQQHPGSRAENTGRSLHILVDVPENSRGSGEAEVAHAPRLKLDNCQLRIMLGNHSALVDVIAPRLHIIDQHMHRLVLCQ
jgi:hypothetical protein